MKSMEKDWLWVGNELHRKIGRFQLKVYHLFDTWYMTLLDTESGFNRTCRRKTKGAAMITAENLASSRLNIPFDEWYNQTQALEERNHCEERSVANNRLMNLTFTPVSHLVISRGTGDLGRMAEERLQTDDTNFRWRVLNDYNNQPNWFRTNFS